MRPHLDWFTTCIHPDGRQSVHIRVTSPDAQSQPVFLDKDQSQLLQATLNHLANDSSIPWSEARQAVLRAFHGALRASS